MNPRFLICLLLYFCILYSSGSITLYAVEFSRIYSDKDGLSMNIGVSITQDKKGYIWIATQEGVNRFNGQKFDIFKDELPSSYVNNLYYSSVEDTLWFCTKSGIASYKDGKFNTYKIDTEGDSNENLNKKDCNCIVQLDKEQSDKKMIAGTEGGLFVCELNNNSHQNKSHLFKKYNKCEEFKNFEKNDLLDSKIKDIEIGPDKKKLYIGTYGKGVVIVDMDNSNAFSQLLKKEKPDLASDNISTLYWDSKDDGLWIGTDVGLSFYKEGKIEQTFTSQNSCLPDNKVTCIFRDKADDRKNKKMQENYG